MMYNLMINEVEYKVEHVYIDNKGRYIQININGAIYQLEEEKVFNYKLDFFENDYIFGFPKELIEYISNRKQDIQAYREKEKKLYDEKIKDIVINIYRVPLADKTIRTIYKISGKEKVLEAIEIHKALCKSRCEDGEFDYTKVLDELNIEGV